MHEESIDEPLRKVYALFDEGKIQPLALEWGKQKLKVTRINSNWIDRSLPFRHRQTPGEFAGSYNQPPP